MNEPLNNKTYNKQKRLIYSYEFPDEHVYVGLTCYPQKRNYFHMNCKDSQVHKYMNKTGFIPNRKFLTEYIDVKNAQKQEGKWVKKYQNWGWNILNKIKTGSIGGSVVYWTKEKCKKEALKYDDRVTFAKKSTSAYISARKNKWLGDVCEHMGDKKEKKFLGL